MKIIIFTSNRNSYGIKRLKEESENRKIKTETYNYKDISLVVNGSNIYFLSGGKKISFKSAVVRVGRPQLYDIREIKIYDLLLKYFYQKNIFFINKNFLENNDGISNKAIQYITLSKYIKKLISPTFYFESKEELINNIKKIKYPIIIKPVDGSKGTGIQKINDENQLIETFKYLKTNNFIFQKYIPNNGDIRILYLGGKYIGSMIRRGQGDSIVNNYSKGGSVEKYILNKNIQKELNTLIKKLNIDYIGIDLIIKNGTYYILEINKNPGFKGFEFATGQNIAGKIIDFLQKHAK